jgi:transcriptional regulator GlxA family with amidase domain
MVEIKNSQKTQSYSYFRTQKELNEILLKIGIIPKWIPFKAEFEKKENWESPSDLTIQQKIGKIVIYIEENLTKELSLQKLADEIELSKYQLIRSFRREEGTTPWKFLMEKRIEKAKELLEEGMSPGHAAVETGFYDQSHMNKVFRENTGKTPKEYQEENFNNRN